MKTTFAARALLTLGGLWLVAGCGGATPTAGEPSDVANGPAEVGDGDGAPADGAGDGAGEGAAAGSEGGGERADGAATSAPADKPADKPGDTPSAEAAPKPSAQELVGTLSPAQVAKFVEEHHAYFDPCIDIVEKAGPVYRVQITTKVHVGPRGVVNDSRVTKSTAKDKGFDTCVADAFRKIAFGKPNQGATATLTFPMTFVGAEE